MLRRRGVLILLVVLGALVVIVTASRTWVSGSVDDVVLGQTSVSATGSEVAGGVVALALVVVAGAVASATAGPRARVVALVLTLLASLGGVALVARVLLDPDA
ncbi:Trp biosynthesis-associated membrane protein, partial [Knoellia flava]